MELSGHTLGKYILSEEIGRGAMGAVFKGYDTTLDRPVAVKVLAPHLTWEPNFVERFLREARVAARLKHHNIVTIFDVGQEGGWYYFVMEYLPGETLREHIRRRGALPPDEVLQVAGQLASALDYAHGQGVVHRDVKPGNVIVSPDGRVTLTDFGIVKAASETHLTATGVTVGTPEYMAPEQAGAGQASAASDLYSLAVVTYEMLSGQVPFQADNTVALLYRIVHEPPPPLRQRRPDLPPSVETVLQRALAKNPQARYPSGAAFVHALELALAGRELPCEEPPTVLLTPQHPPAPPSPPRPAGRLMPAWAWAVAGLFLVLLAVLPMVILFSHTETPLPTQTATPAVVPVLAQGTPQTELSVPRATRPTATPSSVLPTATATPTPDLWAEISTALNTYNRVRAQAETTLNPELMRQIAVDPYLTIKMQRIQANKDNGSHWETPYVSFTINSLTPLGPDQVEAWVTKLETKLYYPAGATLPDDEICRGNIYSYRYCTYRVRYVLVRQAGVWYVSIAEDQDPCESKCQH